MFTGFFPVAADLAVRDEVLAVGTHAFAEAVEVVAKRHVSDGVWSVEFSDGTTLLVGATDGVDLRPPF